MMSWYTDTQSLFTPPTAEDAALWEARAGTLELERRRDRRILRTREGLDTPDVNFSPPR